MAQAFPPRLSAPSELHRLAEALWEERSPLRKGPAADPHSLIHELGVQRFELELKNGDLSAAYNETWYVLERYTELYDFAPAAYFTVMTNGRIGEANFAAATLLGVERSALIGASMLDFVDEAHHPAFQAYLQEIGKAPSLCRQIECGLHKANGTPLHVRLNGACGDFVPNHGREVKVAMFDLTEREQARTALAAERDLATACFDEVAVFMLFLDPEGRILRINRKGVELLHYDAQEELIGRNWFSQCLPEREGRKSREGFLEMLRGRPGDQRPHEAQILCRDGSKRPMTFRDSVMRDARSQVIGVVSVGEEQRLPERESHD
jgi:PAS domain S-box-containing protein